jgi:hypothetical protein
VRSSIVRSSLFVALGALLVATPAPRSAAQSREPVTSRLLTGVSAQLPAFYRPFGKITQVVGLDATATRGELQRKPSAQPPHGDTIRFPIPSSLAGKVVPGQPVWTTLDGAKVRFSGFPIVLDKVTSTVGRGGLGKGKFLVTTKEVSVGSNGKIFGTTVVESEDKLEGFSGAAWLEAYKAEGGPLYHGRLGCWGVNMSSKRSERWEHKVPTEEMADFVQAHTVVIFHGRDPGCGEDKFAAAMDDLKKAGEAAGPWIEAFTGGSSSDEPGDGPTGSGPTQPTR